MYNCWHKTMKIDNIQKIAIFHSGISLGIYSQHNMKGIWFSTTVARIIKERMMWHDSDNVITTITKRVI